MSIDDEAAQDSDNAGENLSKTMDALNSVDDDGPAAEQNADSMTDNEGRVVKFNDDGSNQEAIQGEDS